MMLWSSSIFAFLVSIFLVKADFLFLLESLAKKKQLRVFHTVESVLNEIEDALQAGNIPTPETWERLPDLPTPWGPLTDSSLKELRQTGGAILPTLKRLKALVQDQRVAFQNAQSKSAQALAQALVCATLVPLLGSCLYALIPGIENDPSGWIVACLLAMGSAAVGALWLLHMSQVARWGGLAEAHRPWILAAQCAGERFLALVRAGTPPDIAWLNCVKSLATQTSELATAWGHTLWETPQTAKTGPTEKSIINAGIAIRKSVQLSLMEGRPCVDRVETSLEAMRQDLKSHIERELTLLPTRALKPLFIFIAPALLGLLGYGIWLASADSLSGV